MPRAEVLITTNWEQIAPGVATVTIKRVGAGQLLFNDVTTDVAAEVFNKDVKPGQQLQKSNDGALYARSTQSGWEIIVDG